MAGRIVAVIEGGQIYFVRTDHIGRPVLATTQAGTVVWTASYLPFGGVHVTTGAPIDPRFPGQWFQAESGLHQNWMRDYDPTTGRYIEADPLGLVDGASVYGYARQNPGRYVDPRGEVSIIPDNVAGMCDVKRAIGMPVGPECTQRYWAPKMCPAQGVEGYDAPPAPRGYCTFDHKRIDPVSKETLCVYTCPDGSQRSFFGAGIVFLCPAAIPY